METIDVQESQASQYFDSSQVRVLQSDVVAWNSREKVLSISTAIDE